LITDVASLELFLTPFISLLLLEEEVNTEKLVPSEGGRLPIRVPSSTLPSGGGEIDAEPKPPRGPKLAVAEAETGLPSDVL
jgi:hypothetical protein